MKKLILSAVLAVAAFAASADVITNTVVIVSNTYNNVFHETVVTQKVQNTHFNYYFTNHETVVVHESHLISQTNKTVSLEVGNSYLIAASNQANRAASAVGDARDFADASARSASASASSASSASASASSAAATRSAAASECASALATINARINWFDQHSGETITQINYNYSTNIYYAEDSVARSMAANAATMATNNQEAISSLESRVGNNIEVLQVGLAAANSDISSANARISASFAYTTAVSNGLDRSIGSLQGDLSAVASGLIAENARISASFAYTTAVSNKLEKSSRSRFGIDYVYIVQYRVMDGSTGQIIWSNVGSFKVDPLSARLVSTDSSGTKKYAYSFVNSSSSTYKMTVSAVYKYVPVSGGSYMVVVADKGTSQNAAVSSPGETVLYGSDSTVTVTSNYRFYCDTLGGAYQLEVVKSGVVSAGGNLYKPKLKVVVSDEAGAVDSVVLYGDLQSVSNALDAAIASMRSTVGSHTSSIGSLNSSVSSLGSRVSALEAAGDAPNEAHVYVHGGTTYSKVHVYDEPVDDGKVYVDGSAVTGYRITPNYRYPTTTSETWVFEPAYCDTNGEGLRLFYLPRDTKPIQYSSSARTRFTIPEYLYWQNGYIYVKLRTYTDGVYDGGYAIARYSNVNYPNAISSAISMSLVEKSSGWSNNAVATIQSVSMSGSGVPIWFAGVASAYQQAIVNWMVTGK